MTLADVVQREPEPVGAVILKIRARRGMSLSASRSLISSTTLCQILNRGHPRPLRIP